MDPLTRAYFSKDTYAVCGHGLGKRIGSLGEAFLKANHLQGE